MPKGTRKECVEALPDRFFRHAKERGAKNLEKGKNYPEYLYWGMSKKKKKARLGNSEIIS